MPELPLPTAPDQNVPPSDAQAGGYDPIANIYQNSPAQTETVQTETPQEVPQEMPPETAAPEVVQPQPSVGYHPMGIETEEVVSAPPPRRFALRRWQKIVLVVFIMLGATLGAMATYTVMVLQKLKVQASELQVLGRGAYDQFKAQNLPATDQAVKDVAQKMKEIRATYGKLGFYNFLPIAHNYYQDGLHGFNAADAGISAALKSLEAVTPYADVLGFQGQGTFTGGTTEDRLKIILQTLQKITPQLDTIAADLKTMDQELAQINPNRYPEQVQGKPVRQYITQAQGASDGAYQALTQFRPALEQLPKAAGADGKRKTYFILFENDNELRPTGGFLTAFSIIHVENGKVTPEKSDDIYSLDKKFTKKLPIPPILGKYLTTEKNWHLRDMNIDPDFKKSMSEFLTHYREVPDELHEIDGIIAVDTHVLVDLLKVLGPVEVPGYGTFTAENTPKCDCPQIIYALSEIADKPTPFIRENRKGVLGPLMREILTKAYGAPKTSWPNLFETGWKDVQDRHVQMYFFDTELQKAAEVVGAAGVMAHDKDKAQDFLAVVDANLGGAKSNLFTTNEITQEVSMPENGMITKKITLTYKNSRKGDNCNLEAGLLCLNATLRDWNRVYLPKGSKLISSNGYKSGTVKEYDEENFTVIDGEFSLEPMSQAKVQLEVSVPYTDAQHYKVQLWKQGGLGEIPVVMDINGNQEKVIFEKDTIYQAKF